MEKVVRFSISIEPDLLEKFDALIRKSGYTNRSEAIRDIIRKSLISEESTSPDSQVIGSLTILYNHHTSDLTKKLLTLQHSHPGEILSTLHIHIDHDNCLEVIILRGRREDVDKISGEIKALKGVKYGELAIVSTSS
ncbi:MAG TPA: nickel-responsive transcriptional regulator NikR, partial [Thermoplasmatales archaeon]|nr:nickel-responsive transcriptional regulator NikR [Thermoplasmatales archaeon]